MSHCPTMPLSGVRASTWKTPIDATPTAEVIVVGAGPAGSTAAAFLARAGIDVLVLEKSSFPREKVCGDGLTPRAVRMMNRLGIDTSTGAGWRHNLGLRIYGGRSEPFEMPWPQLGDYPDYGMVCPRETFDDLLAGIALQSGARLLTSTRVSEPIVHPTSGRIVGVKDAEGVEYRAPVVVAADGNSARLALQAGRDRIESRPMGVAVRAYYTSPKSEMDWMESYLELWDGQPQASNLLPGYGWIFGVGDGTANVGLGILNSSAAFAKTDYRQLMRRWLDNTPEAWGLREANQIGAIRGAALPMSFNRQPFYADGLLLVGDSAGMISPFNGEGISYAMEAAEMAAWAIIEARGRGFGSASAEKALYAYTDRVKDAWGGYYRLGNIFVKLIGNPRIMHACATYGLPRRRLMRLVHKLLANLTDSHRQEFDDLVINILSKLAPAA